MSRLNFNISSLANLSDEDRVAAELAVTTGKKMAEHYQNIVLYGRQSSEGPDFTKEEQELFDNAMDLISFLPKAKETALVSATLKVFLSGMMEFYRDKPELFVEHLEIDKKPYEAHGYLVEMRMLHDNIMDSFEPIDKHFTEVFRDFEAWIKSSFSTRSRFQQKPGGPS